MTTTHMHPGPTSPLARSLLQGMAKNWWLWLLRGVAAIVFGVLAFVWPGLTLLTLVFLWGAYALFDGILALGGAISGATSDLAPRWWLAIVGIAGIAAGLLAFFWPGVTALVLLLFIAGWSIATGVMQIIGAIQLRKEIQGEWLLVIGGLISIALGIVLIVQPGTGALALIWLIGIFAILVGCDYIALAFRLKSLNRPA